MKLDRRQFFKTMAAGAVVASLPAVADITPKAEPSKQDRQKLAKFFKAAATGNPAAIQACRDAGIEMEQVTDGGFWMEESKKGKLVKCYIEKDTDRKEDLFTSMSDGTIVANLEGYAVIPIKEWEKLTGKSFA